jgi:hypothetical protein
MSAMVHTNGVALLGEGVRICFARRHEDTKSAILFRCAAPFANPLSKFRVSVVEEMALRAKVNPFMSSCLRAKLKNPDLSGLTRRVR